MMVEAEATENDRSTWSPAARQAPTEEVVAAGLEAAKPFIRALCEAQQQLADVAAKPTGEFPTLPGLPAGRAARPCPSRRADELPQALTIAGKQEREARLDEIKAAVLDKARRAVRGPREGDRRARSAR